MRVEHIGEATLYCGDCREVLPTLPRVDAVVTDPPYGVRDDVWDAMDEREFATFSMSWISSASRLAPELITFGYVDGAVHRLCAMAFPEVRTMIWHKPAGSQLSGASHRGRWFAFEAVFHCHSGAPPKDAPIAGMIRAARESAGLSRGAIDIQLRGKKTGLCFRWEEGACLPTPEQATKLQRILAELPHDFRSELDRAYAGRAASAQAFDVLSYQTKTGGLHPCEKPVGLMLDLLEVTGRDWLSIVDPFMGVGSTGVAAAKCGKRFVGIESDPKYFETACKRIRDVYAQPRLFTEPAPKPVQGAMEI